MHVYAMYEVTQKQQMKVSGKITINVNQVINEIEMNSDKILKFQLELSDQ